MAKVVLPIEMSTIELPTKPTLFHALNFSSSRPLCVLMELGIVRGRPKDSASEPSLKKSKSESKSPAVEIVEVSYDQLKNDPCLAKLNPQKRLPFFFDPAKDLKLNESGGLVEYLLETYDPEHTLHPAPGTDTRAEFLRLLHFGPATAYHIGVHLLFPGKDLEEKKKQWHEVVAPTLEQALEKYGGPYLLGKAFSAADAVIGYDMVTVAAAECGDELFAAHPSLKEYHELLKTRPSYADIYSTEK